MRKLLFLHFILLACAVNGYAQEEDVINGNAASLTPFTGMDYVRLVVEKSFVLSPSNTFKVIIASSTDGKTLWQGSVKPAAAANEGGQYIAFTVKHLKPVLWTPENPYL